MERRTNITQQTQMNIGSQSSNNNSIQNEYGDESPANSRNKMPQVLVNNEDPENHSEDLE